MINRTLQHQIDTKAIRQIFTQIDENWLIRNLDERDYGVDLTLERFDDSDATGNFILVQVKGTQSKFNKDFSLSGFPTKTIEYSLLFDIPFFVFYTSLDSNQTKFIWLQKYVDLKLKETTTHWKGQSTVTLYFPEENDLQTNINKITSITNIEKSKKDGIKYIFQLEELLLHSSSVTTCEQFGVANYCSEIVKKFMQLSTFIKMYSEFFGTHSDYSYDNIDLNILYSAYRQIETTKSIDSEKIDIITKQLKLLEMCKNEFLQSNSLYDFVYEIGGEEPY